MERDKLAETLARVEALAVRTTERALWVNDNGDAVSDEGAECAANLFTIAAGMRAMLDSQP